MKGNAVMKAKRVTGPSAQTQLALIMATMRCSHPGCDKPPIVSFNRTGTDRRKACADHLVPARVARARAAQESGGANHARSWKPW